MSALSQTASDYLTLRHALGYRLVETKRLLPRFVAYLDATQTPTVTVETALAWSTQGNPATTMASLRIMIARGFARHMADIDPATEVPPLGSLPSRQHWRPPFIYSPADIDASMRRRDTSAKIPTPKRARTHQPR
jgi:integrase/recombinase XerD